MEIKNLNFDLKKSGFISAIWLDFVFPRKNRRLIASLLNVLILLSLILIVILSVGIFNNGLVDAIIFPRIKVADFLSLVVFLRLIVFASESFLRSKSAAIYGTGTAEPRNFADFLDFESATLLVRSLLKYRFVSPAAILKEFSDSEIGFFTFLHLGIAKEDFESFLEQYSGRVGQAPAESLPLFEKIYEKMISSKKELIGVDDIILTILEDEQIFKFFFDRQIKKEDFAGMLDWSISIFRKKDRASRWWLEENLARLQGIAKDWAYGATYLLDHFSRLFSEHHFVGEHQIFHFTGHQKQIEAIETILSRQAQANVLIVGEPGVGKRTIIAGFDNMINTGRIRPELEYKRILELMAGTLVASAKTKGELEELILGLFNDAVKAGNIILVIDNFPEFLNSGNALGVSVMQLIGPYLNSKYLQVIAVADSAGFKRYLEPNSSLMQYFETIRVEEPDKDELHRILEDVSLEIEQMKGVIVLYQAISEVIRSSDRYYTEGALPERAIDMLDVVSSRVAGLGRPAVLPQDISDFISEKIKMPLGALKPEEKEKLMNLEEVLHRRIVNQEEAINAISAAARRARVGIQEAKKPLASFLFLGPTGVGKTETAKALAEVYFGSDEAMTRFDMSEYQSEDGLERLIGSFEKNEPGILAANLRAKPYGLLLLDEFEKCHQKAKELFLQILDEGFFSDAFGRKVLLRNNIIIATSNAGSQLIFELGKKGVDPATLKESIIEEIQKSVLFKAELLNRFDAIIIFHNLSREHLKEISKLMLMKLKKRLSEKELELIINEPLIEKVADIGYDPVFGARPMQRAIQERIEKKIAELIIEGKIERGAKIEFTSQDLEKI